MPSAINFNDALVRLSRGGIDFILVGGVAALAHGAPLHTDDLDIVYSPTPENIDRLLDFLDAIHARYRDPAGRHIVADAGKLADVKVNLLQTDLGHLDLLQSVGDGLDFQKLLRSCKEIEIAGQVVRVMDLESLVESKRFADRPKDRAALPVLSQLLEVVRRRGGSN